MRQNIDLEPAETLFRLEGKPFSIRYEEVNAMLLNEFIKAHRKVESLEEGTRSTATADRSTHRASAKGQRAGGSERDVAATRCREE